VQGLMIGVEMVDNAEKRTPMNTNAFGDIWENCKDRGVLLGKGGINGNVSQTLITFLGCKLIKFHLLLCHRKYQTHLFKKKVFRIKPPMCITKEDADLTLNVFEGAVKNQLNN
jgi:alanine-glyoxylate transaminase / (R)-3-amino-2-methylpropionate-pyruvate transaminase